MRAPFPRLAAAALAAGLLAGPAAAGDTLDGAAIKAALAGATTSGVNAHGNPYTVHFLANGKLEGVAGQNGEYTDTGTWWVDGDSLCRRWSVWLDGKTGCFAVSIAADVVTWTDKATGISVEEHYKPPR